VETVGGQRAGRARCQYGDGSAGALGLHQDGQTVCDHMVERGRVVFEGTTPPPIPGGEIRVPMYSPDGPACRSGPIQIAGDWTFRLEGLIGTCSGPPSTIFGPWTLKAVLHEGENLLNRTVTFEPGQHLRDVQILFTDRKTELTFHVADEHGVTTPEYVALVFPADKSLWVQPGRVRTFVPPSVDMMLHGGAVAPEANPPRVPMPAPMRPEAMSGLPAGEYYVAAVDDIEGELARDPFVLERLAPNAVKVTLWEGVVVEAALRRVSLADVLARR
jgi:hypothetical protein